MAASLSRALLLALALSISVWAAGCRSVAPERFGELNPRLGELLLVGFHGTALQDNADLERVIMELQRDGNVVRTRSQVVLSALVSRT